MESYDILLKGLIIGETNTGKSSIVSRFARSDFNFSYIATIGIDFAIKSIKFGDLIAKIQLWDAAGQERFRGIINSYYRYKHFVIIAYDITNKETFDKVPYFLEMARNNNKISFFTAAIVGTKTDLSDKREVSVNEGKELAEKEGCLFFEVSAKSNINIQFMMECVAEDAIYSVTFKNNILKMNQLRDFEMVMNKKIKDNKNEDKDILIV